GKTFIVVGNDTIGGRFAQFFQCEKSQVTIEEQIFPRHIFLGMHHEWFDQTDFFEGHKNRFVPVHTLLRVFHLPNRKDIFEWQSDLAHLESDFRVAHSASLCLGESFDHRYFGIVARDSALNSVTKLSSASSLLNAVTIKPSL